MTLLQWVAVFQQLQDAGARGDEVATKIRGLLHDEGFDVDAAMDAVIANATRREQLARQEAAGVSSVSGPVGGAHTGD